MTGFFTPMLDKAKKIRHEIAHKFSANTGVIELWWEETKPHPSLMVGFRCDHCDMLTDIHESFITKLMREERNK